MKKIFIYFFAFLFICFIFPALLTKREKETSSEVNNIEINDTSKVEENAQSQYEYKKYGTIKLLHQKTGEVEEVNLDTYLCNVVSAEMPADYEKEALKAQAVVARTYTIYKIENKKHDNADICDSSTCCQAWVSNETRLERWEESKREENWNKIEQCVNETKGKIVTKKIPDNTISNILFNIRFSTLLRGSYLKFKIGILPIILCQIRRGKPLQTLGTP